jgi:hypothetical protein
VRSKYPIFEDGIVKYRNGAWEHREPIYIPVGTFITAWARHTTINAAQSVYDRFLYADTDSLHLTGTDLPKELEIDPDKLGAWKHEGTFRKGRYLRQKSYIEDLIISEKEYNDMLDEVQGLYIEDGQHYHMKVTCAGMPEKCYQFVTWDNFREGSSFDGKLMPTHVPGGIVLKDIAFTING